MPVRLSSSIPKPQRRLIRETLTGLPTAPGSPVFISAQVRLTAYRGRLLSGRSHLGTAVHAASFLRERRIVLERELFSDPAQLRLILAHEILHFYWPVLSNGLRASYTNLIEEEIRAGARNEAGESSSVRKLALAGGSRCWKEYVCESFCDTGAWLYTGVLSPDFRLALRWRKKRLNWFRDQFERYWELRCS